MHRSAAQSGEKCALIPGGIHYRQCLESSSGREQLPTVYGGGFMSATMHPSTSQRYCCGNTSSTCNRAEISPQQWGNDLICHITVIISVLRMAQIKMLMPRIVVRLEKASSE